MSPALKIGQFAALLGVTPKTVRHYHALRLLDEPARAENGYRLYSAEALIQVRQVQRLQAAGLSLRQIRELLTSPAPRLTVRTALECQRQKLGRDLEILRTRQHHLQVLLDDDDTWGRVLKSVEPSSVPEYLVSALEQWSLPPEYMAVDLEMLGTLGVYRWPAAQLDQWQTELTRWFRHPEFSHWLSVMLGLLSEADRLGEAEIRTRMTHLHRLTAASGDQPQVSELQAVLRAAFRQLQRASSLTPGQLQVLAALLQDA